jgi:hypothetical protein
MKFLRLARKEFHAKAQSRKESAKRISSIDFFAFSLRLCVFAREILLGASLKNFIVPLYR